MGKFDNIIIVSDIDGTFLGKNSRMVPENLEAIEYFKSEGGLFTIATGREIYTLLHRIPSIAEICNAPVIAVNGAYIYDLQKKQIISEVFLPEPECSVIAQAARAACPDVSLRIACGGKHLTDKYYPILQSTMERYPGWIQIVPYEDIPHGRWHQITWMDEPEALARVREVIQPHFSECTCSLGGSTLLEVHALKATKGAMLSRLKSLLGKESATLWAIGDYENDYLMLKMADRCAMPSNGIDKLRSLSGIVEVCGHDEGAIAGLIRHIEQELEEAQ